MRPSGMPIPKTVFLTRLLQRITCKQSGDGGRQSRSIRAAPTVQQDGILGFIQDFDQSAKFFQRWELMIDEVDVDDIHPQFISDLMLLFVPFFTRPRTA